MKNLMIILLLCFVTGMNAQVMAEQNEDFDPMTLNEPPIAFMNRSDIYEIISDIHDFSYGAYATENVSEIEMQGWKIQVFSTKSFYEADSIKNITQTYFPNEEVVTVFNSPYYKIRLGNCKNRNDAEELLQAVKRRQYGSPWIIPSRIRVRENISTNK